VREGKAIGAENINIGPCNVTYKGVDLGLTKGGVSLEVSTDKYETTVDQFGDTPVFSTINKRDVMVTVPMVETTIDNLALTMPGSKIIVDDTDPTIRRIDISSGVGINLLEIAGPLVLHPISQADDDFSKDVEIPLATTGGGLSFAYETNEERIFNVEFMGFVNTDTASENYQLLLSVGDPAATAA